MSRVDIVVPVYNEESSISPYWIALHKVTRRLEDTFNLIFVDDGSTDNTINKIKELIKYHNNDLKNISIQYISFNRNYGKEAALLAGLRYSRGDYTIIMDVDLQDPPELIPELIDNIKVSGREIINTVREPNKLSLNPSDLGARIFYKLTNMPMGLRDYSIFTGEVRERLINLPEYSRFTRFLLEAITQKENRVYITFSYVDRSAGDSKWNFQSLLTYAMQGIISTSHDRLIYLQNMVGVAGLLLFFLYQFLPALLSPALLFLLVYVVTSEMLHTYYMDNIYKNSCKRPLYYIKEIGGKIYE